MELGCTAHYTIYCSSPEGWGQGPDLILTFQKVSLVIVILACVSQPIGLDLGLRDLVSQPKDRSCVFTPWPAQRTEVVHSPGSIPGRRVSQQGWCFYPSGLSGLHPSLSPFLIQIVWIPDWDPMFNVHSTPISELCDAPNILLPHFPGKGFQGRKMPSIQLEAIQDSL